MKVDLLTISHRCEFEHCVQRTLEIGQLIWKGGSSSPERCSTEQRTTCRLGAPTSTSAFHLGPSTDLQLVFSMVGSHKSKLSRAKVAWKQEQDSLGKVDRV